MIQFQCLPFEKLSTLQLYEVMKLRQEVFVVEQDCVYLDADDKDQKAWHLLGVNEAGQLLAYSRILPKGLSYTGFVSFGRVATAQAARGKGYGQELIKETLHCCEHLFGKSSIKIGAQTYLVNFYMEFGFKSIGEEYLEDGIPHISMVKEL